MVRVRLIEHQVHVEAERGSRVEVDGDLRAHNDAFRQVRFEPLGDEELVQASHVYEERQHRAISRLIGRTAVVQKEPAQGVHRLVIRVEPIVVPPQAGLGS